MSVCCFRCEDGFPTPLEFVPPPPPPVSRTRPPATAPLVGEQHFAASFAERLRIHRHVGIRDRHETFGLNAFPKYRPIRTQRTQPRQNQCPEYDVMSWHRFARSRYPSAPPPRPARRRVLQSCQAAHGSAPRPAATAYSAAPRNPASPPRRIGSSGPSPLSPPRRRASHARPYHSRRFVHVAPRQNRRASAVSSTPSICVQGAPSDLITSYGTARSSNRPSGATHILSVSASGRAGRGIPNVYIDVSLSRGSVTTVCVC